MVRNGTSEGLSKFGRLRSTTLFEEQVGSILTIQAHQDDTDIACGGTIAKLTRMGKKVTYLLLTDGRHGVADPEIPSAEAIKMRNEEQKRAAKILGVEKVIFLDYPDQHMDSSLELRRRLIGIIRDLKPDIVFTFDPWRPYEGNRDHRHTGIMALEAAGFAYDMFEYPEKDADLHMVLEMYLFQPFLPDTWVDITDTIDLKLDAIRQHETQLGDQIAKVIKEKNARDGKVIGRPYAEAFKVLKRGFPWVWDGLEVEGWSPENFWTP
ncbi:MAG: PIG-L deacetylase family protein [Promethearchaeati archaeon SRVP18_Atabeyarchaeia-1]